MTRNFSFGIAYIAIQVWCTSGSFAITSHYAHPWWIRLNNAETMEEQVSFKTYNLVLLFLPTDGGVQPITFKFPSIALEVVESQLKIAAETLAWG